MRVVVVAGTRTYITPARRAIIDAALEEHRARVGSFVVHGACPTGVDAYMTNWCSRHGVQYAECPALWKRFGKAAGPMRNRAMLEAFKPELVLAFPATESPGTWGCVDLAVELGFNVRYFELPDEA